MKKQKKFILKLKTNWKIFKIDLFYGILGFVELALIYFIAWFNERLLEVSIMIPLFFIYRKRWEKQFHAKTLFKCATYSVILFAIISLTIPSKNISIFVSVFAPYFITFCSYHLRNYLDMQNLLSKKLESMTFKEMKERFTNLTDYEINCAYEYINRKINGRLADNIAMKYGYSTRHIQRIIKKMKDELK